MTRALNVLALIAVLWSVPTVLKQQRQLNRQQRQQLDSRVQAGAQRCELTKTLALVAAQGDPVYVRQFDQMTRDCERLLAVYRKQAER